MPERPMHHPSKPLPTGYRGIAILVMLLVLPFTAGCGMFSSGKAVKVSLPEFDRGKLINTALFIPFENDLQQADAFNLQSFQNKVAKLLKTDCKGLNLLTPDDPSAAPLMQQMTADMNAGGSLGFSEAARAAGIAAVITGRIASVATDERSWGIWWFTDSNYYLNVQVDTTIYDMVTGAKMIDASLTREIKIDGLEYDALTMGQSGDLAAAETLLEKLAADSAERSCKTLSNQPWIGFVTAVDKAAVTLVPGSASGLSKGMTLHVYGAGTLLQGAMGHRYLLPSPQKAAIEIVSVTPDRAKARILGVLGDTTVAAGDVVRRLK